MVYLTNYKFLLSHGNAAGEVQDPTLTQDEGYGRVLAEQELSWSWQMHERSLKTQSRHLQIWRITIQETTEEEHEWNRQNASKLEWNPSWKMEGDQRRAHIWNRRCQEEIHSKATRLNGRVRQ